MKKLKTYKRKRDFSKTSEPKDNRSEKKKYLFVIQKHDARNLHYDFRLNIENVLVSWAIPKGLSTVPNEKHLAIRTEDHPLSYADFEGVIPKGQYGGGTVMVWDVGTYKPLSDKESMKKAIDNGALKFNLDGEKLKGGYAMARIKKYKDKEQWVIFKLDDKYADASSNIANTKPNSALTGRTMEEIENEGSKNK